jgi:hypothetical protein
MPRELGHRGRIKPLVRMIPSSPHLGDSTPQIIENRPRPLTKPALTLYTKRKSRDD